MKVVYQIIVASLALIFMIITWRILSWAYFKAKKLENALKKQGLNGNSYNLIYDGTDEMRETILEAILKPINLNDDIKPRVLALIIQTLEKYVPYFREDSGCVQKVAKSGLDVFAHNIETKEELQNAVRDHRANFKQSLDVVMMVKDYAPPGTLTKTSIMLGCGETPDQVLKTMEKVRAAGVDVITFGQYMRPSMRHMPVSNHITPEAFDKYQVLGMEMIISPEMSKKKKYGDINLGLWRRSCELNYLTNPIISCF